MVAGFDCTLRQHELRVWGRAIHSLCQLGGTDIHFQFTEDALILTTHDAAITTHVTLKFNRTFFSSYSCEASGDLECKIPTKCLLKPFRSVRFVTKCASECKIQFTPNGDSLDLTLQTRFGAQIRYSLRLMADVQLLEVDLDLGSLKSRVTCDAKVILGCLSNFHQVKGAGDLTLKVAGPLISLRSSVTELVRREGKVYTELGLRDVDFMEYSIEQDSQLTFPLRDFKTFTLFADMMKLPVTLRFLNETKPVMVMIRSGDETYEGTLTLANRGGREAPPQLRAVQGPLPTNAQSTLPSIRRSTSPAPPELPSTTSHASAMELFQSRVDTSGNENGNGWMPEDTSDIPIDEYPPPLPPRPARKKRPRPLMFPNTTNLPLPKDPDTEETSIPLILLSESESEED